MTTLAVILVLVISCAAAQTAMFVVGGRTGMPPTLPNAAAYSADGLTWTPLPSSGTAQTHVNAVAYSPERDMWVVAGGQLPTGCPCIGWSLNGTGFDRATEPDNSITTGQGIAWGFNSATATGKFVATGAPAGVATQAIIFSTDGRTWSLVTEDIGSWTEGKDVRYSSFHNRWVAGGQTAAPDDTIYFSSTGSSGWTKATWTGSSFSTCWRLAVSPINGVWLATGSGASYSLAISNDGTVWTLLTAAGSTFNPPLLTSGAVGLTWGGGLFVTGNALSASVTGSDSNAQNWTPPLSAGLAGSLFYFCYSPLLNMYLATGSTGEYAISTDNTKSWQRRPFTFFDSFMEGCAARELSRIPNGSIAPNSVFQGSVVFATGTSSTIPSNATFLGGLTVNGALTLGPQANVFVFGNLTLAGSTSVSQGATVSVNGVLVVLPSASLAVTTTQNTVVVASFQSSNGGPFATVTVNSMPAPPCSQVVFAPSTLSVVVDSGDCGGLSLGAKIGIGLGCAVGGIAIAVLIVLLTKYFIRRRQYALELKLKQDALDQVGS